MMIYLFLFLSVKTHELCFQIAWGLNETKYDFEFEFICSSKSIINQVIRILFFFKIFSQK